MTDTLSPHYRNLSNKENSGLTYPRRPHPGPRSIAASTHSSSASSKPRVSGIGRAPRQARKHSVHKPYRKPSTALPKLQVRSSSVQRAKAKANEELSSRIVMRGRRHGAVPPDLRLDKMSMGETIIEEGDVDMEVDSGSKPTYRLRLVSVPAPRHPSLPRNKHEMANQLSTIRMPSTSASTLHNETQPMTGPNLPRILGRVPTRMPPRLRKPMIPPVIADSTGECVVPIDYVVNRVHPYFETIYDLLPRFAECDDSLRLPPTRLDTPIYSTPFGPAHRLDDMHDKLPYWVESSVPYGGLNEKMQKECFNWGPDACLVVRQKGCLGQEGAFFPIKKVVFTSQCSYFDRLAQAGQTLRGSHQSNSNNEGLSTARQDLIAVGRKYQEEQEARRARLSQARSVLSAGKPALSPTKRTVSPPMSRTSSASSDITVTMEDKENSPSSSRSTTPRAGTPKPSPSFSHPFYAYATPSFSFPPPRPPKLGPEAYGQRYLDLVPIYLPDPTTFPLIVLYLHFPTLSPLRQLLQLPDIEFANKEQTIEHVRCLLPAIIDRLMNRLLGLYANLVELGIGNEVVWATLAHAWHIVYVAYQRRMHVHPPMTEDYQQELPPVVQWRTVVGVSKTVMPPTPTAKTEMAQKEGKGERTA